MSIMRLMVRFFSIIKMRILKNRFLTREWSLNNRDNKRKKRKKRRIRLIRRTIINFLEIRREL